MNYVFPDLLLKALCCELPLLPLKYFSSAPLTAMASFSILAKAALELAMGLPVSTSVSREYMSKISAFKAVIRLFEAMISLKFGS